MLSCFAAGRVAGVARPTARRGFQRATDADKTSGRAGCSPFAPCGLLSFLDKLVGLSFCTSTSDRDG